MRLTVLRRLLFSNLRLNENKIANTVSTGDRYLRKIDLNKDMDKLLPEHKIYIQKLIEKNNERYAAQKKLRRHQLTAGTILFAIVFSIYFYTMFSIQQEKFLDDFDVPEPPDPAVKTFKKK